MNCPIWPKKTYQKKNNKKIKLWSIQNKNKLDEAKRVIISEKIKQWTFLRISSVPEERAFLASYWFLYLELALAGMKLIKRKKKNGKYLKNWNYHVYWEKIQKYSFLLIWLFGHPQLFGKWGGYSWLWLRLTKGGVRFWLLLITPGEGDQKRSKYWLRNMWTIP